MLSQIVKNWSLLILQSSDGAGRDKKCYSGYFDFGPAHLFLLLVLTFLLWKTLTFWIRTFFCGNTKFAIKWIGPDRTGQQSFPEKNTGNKDNPQSVQLLSAWDCRSGRAKAKYFTGIPDPTAPPRHVLFPVVAHQVLKTPCNMHVGTECWSVD